MRSLQQDRDALAELRWPFPEANGRGKVQGGAGPRVASPGHELFGVLLAGGEFGGCGVGEGFLVEAHAAADEPVERLRPKEDQQARLTASQWRSRF